MLFVYELDKVGRTLESKSSILYFSYKKVNLSFLPKLPRRADTLIWKGKRTIIGFRAQNKF